MYDYPKKYDYGYIGNRIMKKHDYDFWIQRHYGDINGNIGLGNILRGCSKYQSPEWNQSNTKI